TSGAMATSSPTRRWRVLRRWAASAATLPVRTTISTSSSAPRVAMVSAHPSTARPPSGRSAGLANASRVRIRGCRSSVISSCVWTNAAQEEDAAMARARPPTSSSIQAYPSGAADSTLPRRPASTSRRPFLSSAVLTDGTSRSPTSPAIPCAPRWTWPPMISPSPMLLPRVITAALSYPRAAPSSCSASAARFASLFTATGTSKAVDSACGSTAPAGMPKSRSCTTLPSWSTLAARLTPTAPTERLSDRAPESSPRPSPTRPFANPAPTRSEVGFSVRATMAPRLTSAVRVRVAPTSIASVAVSAGMASDSGHGECPQHGRRRGALPRQLQCGGDGADHRGIRAKAGRDNPGRGGKAGSDAGHELLEVRIEGATDAALEDHQLGIDRRGDGDDRHRQIVQQLVDNGAADRIALARRREDRLGRDLTIGQAGRLPAVRHQRPGAGGNAGP